MLSSDLDIAYPPIKMPDGSRNVKDTSSSANRMSVPDCDPGIEGQSQSSSPAACLSEARKRRLKTRPDLAESDQDHSVHSTQRPSKRQRCSLTAEQFGRLSCNDQDPIPANSHHCASPKQNAASETKEQLPQPEALNLRFGKFDETTYDGASALTFRASSPASTDRTISVLQAESSDSDLDEDYIRCICGAKADDDFLAMIFCDGCTAWQHNVCMGMSEMEEDLPKQYYCELCKPLDHRKTLRALKRGERIWNTRQEQSWEGKVVVDFRNKIQA